MLRFIGTNTKVIHKCIAVFFFFTNENLLFDSYKINITL